MKKENQPGNYQLKADLEGNYLIDKEHKATKRLGIFYAPSGGSVHKVARLIKQKLVDLQPDLFVISDVTSSPLIWNRSLMRTRCGEVKSPVFLPPASSIAFKYAQTLPFPFVPATWIILIPSCGFPRRERSSLVCSGGCFTVNFGIVSI